MMIEFINNVRFYFLWALILFTLDATKFLTKFSTPILIVFLTVNLVLDLIPVFKTRKIKERILDLVAAGATLLNTLSWFSLLVFLAATLLDAFEPAGLSNLLRLPLVLFWVFCCYLFSTEPANPKRY